MQLQTSHEASFQRMGEATRRMDVAATPKCKESAYGKNKERDEFWGFDDEFFYRHALFLGYDETYTLCNTIKEGKGVWGLASRKLFYKCTSDNAGKCPFVSLYRDVRRTLWLRGCTVQFT